MRYEGMVIRPPSESRSIILQVAIGCPHNRCTFCGAYREVSYRPRDLEEIQSDLRQAAARWPDQHRLFLADGDVLALPTKRLQAILTLIHQYLPRVRRISLYASGRSILAKPFEVLLDFRRQGLDRIYLGVETGDDRLLAELQKYETAASLAEAAEKIRNCGLFLSTTILLGLGGPDFAPTLTESTARLLNRIKPNQLAALTLMVLDNTPLGKQARDGLFIPASAEAVLFELRLLLRNLDLDHTQFMANHPSNYLPLTGRLNRDRERLIAEIERGLSGGTALRPESCRAL